MTSDVLYVMTNPRVLACCREMVFIGKNLAAIILAGIILQLGLIRLRKLFVKITFNINFSDL